MVRGAANSVRAEAVRGEVLAWNGRTLAGHGDRIRNVEVSADGALIASAGGDGTARVWSRHTGENLLTLTGHLSYVEAARFSPDGRHVATASRDGTVKFWNIEGHANTVTSIAFSPDGRTLATGSSDRTARIWDFADGTPRLRHTLRGHADQVHRVAFDPSGARLATAGLDNQLRLWDVASGEAVALPSIPPEHRHKDQLRAVAFSPDGRLLASAGADGHARLYPLAGEGLFTSDGELWRKQRRLMAPLFQPAALSQYHAAMVATAVEITAAKLATINETIAASHADLAVDLRKQIALKLQAGQSRQEIIDFMVAHIGDEPYWDR